MRTLVLAGTALLIANGAAAQTAPIAPAPATPGADDAPADIVVTAQKRSERLQDVPLAVTVVSGDTLAAQGKVSLEGAQYLVPTLNFAKAGTTLNQSLFLRGVGTATFSIAGEPSVSTVLDGVVFSRAGEAFSDLVDIERLEVLRGPQGTLFGKNASAGVINITSKKPGDKLGGYVEAGFSGGSGNEYRARGAIDLPLSAALRTRLTGFYDKYDGNLFNTAVGRRVNGFKHFGFRGIVEGDVGERVKLTFIADYHKNNDDCCAEVIAGAPRFTNPATLPPGAMLGDVNTTNRALIQSILPPLQGAAGRRISQNLVTHTDEVGYGFSLQADVDAGPVTVASISAYRNYANAESRDGDWLGQPYIGLQQLHDYGPQTGETWSQEFRLTSPSTGFFTYVAGFYFSDAKSERVFTRRDITCGPRPRRGRARRRADSVLEPARRAARLPQRHRRLRVGLPERRAVRPGRVPPQPAPAPDRRRPLHGRPARRVPQPGDAACRPRHRRQLRPGGQQQRPRRRRVERRPLHRQGDQHQLVGQGRRRSST